MIPINRLITNQIKRYPPLRPDVQQELLCRAHRGDRQAREKLILHNLRLVTRYAVQFRESSLELADLINAGALGLAEAIDRFDPTQGTKLSTYATFWIKLRLQEAYRQSVKMPHNKYIAERVMRVRAAIADLKEKTGKTPTDQEVAEIVGFGAKTVRDLREAMGRRVISLDRQTEGSDLHEAIPVLEPDQTDDTVEHLLRCLTRRERLLVESFYGLRDREDPEVLAITAGQHRVTLYGQRKRALTKIRRLAQCI